MAGYPPTNDATLLIGAGPSIPLASTPEIVGLQQRVYAVEQTEGLVIGNINQSLADFQATGNALTGQVTVVIAAATAATNDATAEAAYALAQGQYAQGQGAYALAQGQYALAQATAIGDISAARTASVNAATLAGHYSNDNINADVPGGSIGERGAKYWAGVAQAFSSALRTIAGTTEFALFDSGTKVKWFVLTPSKLKHAVIDAIQTSIASLQTSVTSLLASGSKAIPGSTEFALFDTTTKQKWLLMSPTKLRHPVVDRVVVRQNLTDLKRALADTASWGALRPTAEINHIEGLGQSLARGHASAGTGGSGTVLTNTVVPAGQSYAGGVRVDDYSIDPAVIYASLVGLKEQWVDTSASNDALGSQDGETPMSSMVRMFAQLMLDENDVDLGATTQRILVSNSARGQTAAANLAPGSSHWNARSLPNVQNGKVRAAALSKVYAPLATTYVQGEQDMAIGTAASDWMTTVRSIRTGAEALFQAQTGVARTVPMILSQVASHRYYGVNPLIAQAQVDLASEQYFGFATPQFFLPYIAGDLHLTGTGSAWLGAYQGLCLKRWTIDAVKIPPMVPTVRADGLQVIARFPTLPGRRLVVDTVTVAAQPQFGATAVNSSAAAVVLSNARLVGQDTIVWDAASSLTGGEFRLGWQGGAILGLHNLRDDDPLVFDPNGLALPMRRWAPICKAVIS